MAKTPYCPFLSEDFTFCGIFTCAEMASWICFSQGVFTHPTLLCDQHKQKSEREEREPVQHKIEQIEMNVKNALQDIDPGDANALYKRCGQILDEIHADGF